MDRRRFLRSSGGALLALPFGVFLVQACYGGDGPDDDTPAAPPVVSGANAVYTSSIDSGHAHRFALALAALTSPTDTRGQTTVDDGHAHSVAITAAELQSVETGQAVQVTTGSSESHTHVITFVKIA